MKSFTYTVKDENGIHARPAGLLVKEAKALSSRAELVFGGKRADLTRLFAVMGLGVRSGSEVTVEVEGAGEERDAETLEQFFKANF